MNKMSYTDNIRILLSLKRGEILIDAVTMSLEDNYTKWLNPHTKG